MYREIRGDLFDPSHNFDALGHGINLEGVMGSGIAVIFRKMFPAMYQGYRASCFQNHIEPGGIYPWHDARRDQWVYNCATQIRQGANASYPLVAISAHLMLEHACSNNVKSIGIPTIGCGIGGLEWPKVQYIYKMMFESNPHVTLTVVHKS
jgi:O-acetyl-ADP-ribose deacetylase (regulator of RNase III)